MIVAFLGLGVLAHAQEAPKPKVQIGGFIRNYGILDTRVAYASAEDFLYYLPKDQSLGADGTDQNAQTSFKYAALSSRLWVTVGGYEVQGVKVSARVEADFFSGLSGYTGTATMRLRQAFVTLAKDSWTLKLGQAWHPLAADQASVIAMNAGTPFNALNRSPQINFEYKVADNWSLTAAAITQMQYNSNGPNGTSANYLVRGILPELYAAVNYSDGKNIFRVGIDMLSIKPRTNDATGAKVADRITTFTPYVYAQHNEDMWSLKAKFYYGQAGEHLTMNGGYGVHAIGSDGVYEYTPTHHITAWASFLYGKKVQGGLFLGYDKNLGTVDSLVSSELFWMSKNCAANYNGAFRVVPTFIYNLGKVALGLEYELTSAKYGDNFNLETGLAEDNLRSITNNRLIAMVKYTF